MNVRPATPADVQAVLPMVASICEMHKELDAAKYGFLPNPQAKYENWLRTAATSDRSVFLVAEAESSGAGDRPKLVAFLVATVEREIPIYSIKEYGFIHDLWVEPEYRRTGIAKQMVKAAIDRFKQMGVKQIRLDTAAANESARRLFAACGFRASTVEMLTELN